MTNNQDSYTIKNYKRNKKIFLIIKVILIFGYILIFSEYIYLLLRVSTLLRGLPLLFGLIISAIIGIICFRILYSEEAKYKRDVKWNDNTWGKGSRAETSVSDALTLLPPGYKTIPDFYTGKGDIDFIIIGPKGIFIIECKSEKGEIELLNEQIYCNGKVTFKNYINQTLAEKLWLTEKLSKHFNHNYIVTGILEFPEGKINTETIHSEIQGIWIGGYRFHEYLIKKSTYLLSEAEIEKIYMFLTSEKKLLQGQ